MELDARCDHCFAEFKISIPEINIAQREAILSKNAVEIWNSRTEENRSENDGDVISRKEAIAVVAKHIGIPASVWIGKATEWLKAVPTVDAVKVVRCMNCESRDENGFCTGRGWPYTLVSDDGYCDNGKGKMNVDGHI